MALYVPEAAVVGVREALKLGLLWFVTANLCTGRPGGRPLAVAFWVSAAIAAVLAHALPLESSDMVVRYLVIRLSGTSLFLVFFAACIVLLRAPGLGFCHDDAPISGYALVAFALVMIVHLLPEAMAASLHLRDIEALMGSTIGVRASALGGAAVVMGVAWAAARTPVRAVGSIFRVGQFLVLLVVLKLLMGGSGGLGQFSLFSAVQAGVMKFVHDAVHQSFVFLLVPDHALLRVTAWDFIGFFFGSRFAMACSLGLLLVVPVAYLYTSLSARIHAPEDAASGAERRMYRAAERRTRWLRSAPVWAFVLVVVAGWYAGGSGQDSRITVPDPRPLIVDGPDVVIPITGPSLDLMDGALHTFTLTVEGEPMRLLVIKRPDGRLAVCLDACEICPPDGYGQSEGRVVCVYCATPIPVASVGEPGGCNPIPLGAEVTEGEVRVSLDEIASKWMSLVRKAPAPADQGGSE